MRLNKFLSDAGFCSRREADRLITAGKVFIDGERAELGTQVQDDQEVRVGKKIIQKKDRPVLLALHKPRGIECTAEKKIKNNIVDFLNYPVRVYPVGRLDKDSEGLILMTNQGDLVNRIMRAGNRHEKEYLVKVNREITPQFLSGMAAGVALPELHVTTRQCEVTQIGKYRFRIVLTQGLNRQIRRMCRVFGYEVTELRRVRIMNITLGTLEKGKCREIRGEELQTLLDLIRDSSNETVRDRHE